MFRTLLALSTLLVGCEVATTQPQQPQQKRTYVWVFQMPMRDTVAEYIHCADTLRNKVRCSFRGDTGTIEYAFDKIFLNLERKDSSIFWTNRPQDNIEPHFMFKGR
jgi:hypothetical protein